MKRVENVVLHGRSVDIQIVAANGQQMDPEAKKELEEMVKTNNIAVKWVQEIWEPFEPMGHGTHFQTEINEHKTEMVANINRILDLNLKYFTVLWTSHNFAFMILHETRNFI